jgi:tetratricopeptide (TPR) repeat protein
MAIDFTIEFREKGAFCRRPSVAEKIDRKQLKRPDEFQLIAGRAMGWMVAHRGVVGVAAAGVVAAVVLAWGLATWRGAREGQAGAELAEALELQSRPIAGEAPAQPDEQTFPSKEEREKAVVAALDKVRSTRSGTTAGLTAGAELGFHKLKSGDAAGAQKDLQEFLDRAGNSHPLRPFAQESLGYAFEAQNKLDEARAAFEKLRELGLPARADYQVARLALVQGRPEAKEQLERVARDHPKETDVVREANERLALAALPPVGAAQQATAAPPVLKAAEKAKGKKKQ